MVDKIRFGDRIRWARWAGLLGPDGLGRMVFSTFYLQNIFCFLFSNFHSRKGKKVDRRVKGKFKRVDKFYFILKKKRLNQVYQNAYYFSFIS
jgi:hypothetical protein